MDSIDCAVKGIFAKLLANIDKQGYHLIKYVEKNYNVLRSHGQATFKDELLYNVAAHIRSYNDLHLMFSQPIAKGLAKDNWQE